MPHQQLYIKTTRGVEGPFSPPQIREFAANGTLKPDDHVSDDRKRWVTAAKVRGLEFPGKEQRAGAQSRSPERVAGADSAPSSTRSDDGEVFEWLDAAERIDEECVSRDVFDPASEVPTSDMAGRPSKSTRQTIIDKARSRNSDSYLGDDRSSATPSAVSKPTVDRIYYQGSWHGLTIRVTSQQLTLGKVTIPVEEIAGWEPGLRIWIPALFLAAVVVLSFLFAVAVGPDSPLFLILIAVAATGTMAGLGLFPAALIMYLLGIRDLYVYTVGVTYSIRMEGEQRQELVNALGRVGRDLDWTLYSIGESYFRFSLVGEKAERLLNELRSPRRVKNIGWYRQI